MSRASDRAIRAPSRHRLATASLAIPLAMLVGVWAARARRIPRAMALPDPLAGERRTLESRAGRLAWFVRSEEAEGVPLLLIHSINAAATAYEVRPLFDRIADRPVYALDLPGYGLSDRADRSYTPRLMTDAILAMTEVIAARHGGQPIDALALSLSCEFLARAASEAPRRFRTLALVSPTGFDSRGPRNGPPGSTRAMPRLHAGLTGGPWRRPLFELLTSRASIRFFLQKTWGSKAIDEGLARYDYRTTHQPGAEHAPYAFLSGYLFSNDITRVYESLTLPVWLVHGTRGDFTDYRGKRRIEGRPNWTVTVLETGALPQFEMPEGFLRRYASFLAARGA